MAHVSYMHGAKLQAEGSERVIAREEGAFDTGSNP